MEKVSRYLVLSEHTYKAASGMRIRLVYATRTSKIMAVDLATARSLVQGDVGGVAVQLLPALRDIRVIVASDEDEMQVVLDRNRRASSDQSSIQVSLLPTSYCNMGCSYCGQEHARGGLSRNHRDRVRDRVLRKINAPATANVRIDWFGGEPLIGYAVIRDLAPQFVAAAKARGLVYRSFLVTNGSLLNLSKIDTLIRSCGISHFEITVDGPPEVHDVHRPLKNGRGSFWHIVRTVREAVDNPDYSETTFQFRTNVDVANRESISRYINIMADLNFSQPNVRFSVAPVHSWGNDVSQIEVAKKDFAAQELEWLRMFTSYGLKVPLLPQAPNKVVCPAGTLSAELISGTGKIFSCTEHPLVPQAEREFALADISDPNLDLQRPKGQFDDWNDDIQQGKSWCTSCVFMPTCGGACPKAWKEGHSPCPSYKFNFQGRLDIFAAELGLTCEAELAGACE